MFLKRIELQGFKSFADKTVISFEHGVTGIVGPNGCGKSNITDAVRWVLGEQSVKSLRSGSAMSDIIFAGSQTRRPVNIARVSLVFDNTRKIFPIEFDEVEITRQIHRSREAEYSINRTPCRLKDISDLVMDTGLGRDSLSIITQGNISSFADARPEERRALFEEAAGVAKYKKRKKSSLHKLEQTDANLERLQDILDELHQQAGPLEKQAEKALQQRKLKEELASIEITVLASRIESCQEKTTSLEGQIESLQQEKTAAEQKQEADDQQLQHLRHTNRQLDSKMAHMQNEYTRLLQESVALEKRKAALDEQNQRRLDQAQGAEKAKALQPMIAQARLEYEDRKERLATLSEDISRLRHQQGEQAQNLNQTQVQSQTLNADIQRMTSRIQALASMIRAPYAHQQGVKAVMQARNSLPGVISTAAELFPAKEGMAQAVNAALGGAVYNIITEDEAAARSAIDFLKRNRSGRATFLPVSVCRPRRPKESQNTIARNSPGAIGWASELVQSDPAYDLVKDRLLGNTFVCDSLENANETARRLQYSLKIVTLEGDIVHSGGSMTGGSMKNNTSPITLQEEKNSLEKKLAKTRDRANLLQTDLDRQNSLLQQTGEKLMSLQIEQGKLESIAAIKKEKLDSLLAQAESLEAATGEEEAVTDQVVSQLLELHRKADQLQADMQELKLRRQRLGEEMEKLEDAQRTSRRHISSLETSLRQNDVALARERAAMENALVRLNTDYSMTYEFAREQKKELDLDKANDQVVRLRAALKKIGTVNEEAPEEYEALKARLESLEHQKSDLEEAAASIRDAISQMDQTMTVQFKEMFDKINGELEGVFQAMFGGGRARLVLTDPEDMLNTGIDIDVQPPGKLVKNIQTFSGGEKALIAISVLFSILKARTMPLCIFDEAEAALDQANVERFARYISRFKDESQFIVVTHRPGTMEQCDDLYGITMQKDGVSTVLKVHLEDARQYGIEKETA